MSRFPWAPVPEDPHDLADDPRFHTLAWRFEGRNMLDLLTEQLGDRDEAERIWRQAAILVELRPTGFPLAERRNAQIHRGHSRPALHLIHGGAS